MTAVYAATVSIMLKKFLLCFLVLTFVIGLCLPSTSVFGEDTTISEDKDELKELKARLEAIKQSKADLQQGSAGLSGQFENAYAEKLNIENQISLLEEEIRVTSELISDYEGLVEKLTNEMFQKSQEIDKLYDVYDQIVVYYYKMGNPTEFELFLDAGSLSKYLTKDDYAEQILSFMQSVASEIEGIKLDMENDRKTYRMSYDDLGIYKQTLASSAEEQKEAVRSLERLMSTLTGDISMTDAQFLEQEKKQKQLEAEIAALNKTIAQKYEALDGTFDWPIDSFYWKKCKLTSIYGNRNDPFTGEKAFHNGFDIAAPEGTPVQAVKQGKVIKSEYSNTGYGNVIVVQHADGTSTLYGHLSKRLVDKGDKVLQGQVIGRVGNTGKSTASHLHFTIYIGDSSESPAKYLDDYILNAIDIYDYLK